MLRPKKPKYRTMQKGRQRSQAKRGFALAFGKYGLKSLEAKWIKETQLEAAKKALQTYLKDKGKIWIRIFPHKPITHKGDEASMGGGKGEVVGYVFPIEPGRIILEIGGVSKELAEFALKKAQDKLPVKTKIVFSENL